ncbi:hypothetical protein [Paenibacillus segetis]|uniref:Uncharacterized protein n=1 Tax=Paenibacillus segetis TaxID=1325360 RepID=A0ABQ1YRU8_9BACL|nr:hypothetical protein [Paenibacillus segetis]GGH36397.1 hypothetical protein GCM10008013_43250 [Paenibacillus segetis]
MLAKEKKLNNTDHFFAYADNSLGEFELQNFKSLMNFYLIFQDRLVIPDSFLINNNNLITLFGSESYGYRKALEKGIIIPAVRQNITSIEELHDQFQSKGDAHSSKEYIRDIDYFSKKHRLSWDLKAVEKQFTESVLKLIQPGTTQYSEFESLLKVGLHNDIFNLLESKGTLHRLEISNIVNQSYKASYPRETNLFLGSITANYQTNIPNLLNLEIAYPQLKQNLVEGRDLIKESRIHHSQSEVKVKELFDHFDSLLFDKEVLSMLNYEEIAQIRSLPEHKNFIAAWNKLLNNEEKKSSEHENDFIIRLDQFNKEVLKTLGLMVNREKFQQLNKRKKQLKILKYTSTGLKLTNTIISFLPIPGVNYIGSGLSMADNLFEKSISSKEKYLESLSNIQSAAGIEILNNNRSGTIKETLGLSSSRLGG